MSDASQVYREAMDAALVCIQRAKDGTLVGGTGEEFTSVAIKSNAQAALALVQTAVTINKAAIEAKAGRPPEHRRRSA